VPCSLIKSLRKGNDVYVKCQKCGSTDSTGRRCAKCGASLLASAPGPKAEMPPKEVAVDSRLGGFWGFNVFITKNYIKYLFIIGFALITFTCAILLVCVIMDPRFKTFPGGLVGIIAMWFVGVLLFRIFCEISIVLFKIHEELQKANAIAISFQDSDAA